MNKALRIIGIVVVFGLLFLAIVTSNVNTVNVEEKIWNDTMTMGDVSSAVRHYVVYTDLMCPYCNYYGRVVMENDEEVQKYLSEHKIAYEVRVTDMLYESSGVELSRPAAEGAHCASKEGRFWDYYHNALNHIFEDYYEKGIGYSKTAPMISDMERDYWLKIGTEIGLSENYERCFNNRESVAEIQEQTLKASTTASGLPYFAFGKYTTGGFDPSWEWDMVKGMFDSGLK